MEIVAMERDQATRETRDVFAVMNCLIPGFLIMAVRQSLLRRVGIQVHKAQWPLPVRFPPTSLP
jgi:hypothetical protein